MEKRSVGIRVVTAYTIEERDCVLVAGQLVSGELADEVLMRSATRNDWWRVQVALVLGVGPPSDYDLHTDGKWHFTFRRLDRLRQVDEGEEFYEA